MTSNAKRVFALMVALTILNAADWGLTVQALNAGGRELNPLMSAVFAGGAGAALAVKAGILAAASALVWHIARDDWRAVATMSGAVTLYLLIVAWNIGQLI